MVRANHTVVGAMCLLLVVVASPYDATTLSPTAKQMERFMTRTKLIIDEMNRTGQAEWHRQALGEMSESMRVMAEQVTQLDQLSRAMLRSDELMKDHELEVDVHGVQGQIVDLTRSMENVLQYMEHMTYRFSKISSTTSPQAIARGATDPSSAGR